MWLRRSRPLSIRLWLLMLSLAAALPVILYGVYATNSLADAQRDGVVNELRQRARSLADAFERRTLTMITAAQVMAQSPLLDGQRLVGFHEVASRMAVQIGADAIALLAPDGQLLVNTRVPYGEPLPRTGNQEGLDEVFLAHRTHVSNLFRALRTNAPTYSMNVPVWRNGEVRYALSVAADAKELTRLLQDQMLPQGWVAAVVDRNGVIVARSQAAEQLVGQAATASFLEQISAGDSGTYASISKDGLPVMGAFARIPASGWTVAVAVPQSVLERPIRLGLLHVSAAAAAFLSASALLFILFSRVVTRDVERLAATAAAIGNGEASEAIVPRIRELQWLQDSLVGQRSMLRQMQRTAEERAERAEEAERQLAAAMLSKSKFLAAASHDLRQPLQALRLFMEVMLQQPLDPKAAKITAMMDQALRGGEDLLNALLDVARLEAGVVQPKCAVVDCRELLSGLHAECAPAAAAKGIRFRVVLPGAVALYSDPALLTNMLRNLVGNAIKYTDSGTILVGCRRRSGTHLQIQVWDTGPGIAAEQMEHIWEEFFQIGNPERDKQRGLGLGLSIVRKTARLLGHPVQVRSRPGRGSVFYVEVPLADATDGAALRNSRDSSAVDRVSTGPASTASTAVLNRP